MKKIFAKKVLLTLVPLALIVTAAVIMGLSNSPRDNKLVNGQVYEIWIQQAEVTPMNHEGKPWDKEGNAPDLLAMMTWQDQIVLTTVVSHDSLIAQWDQTAVEASQIIQGELDAKSLQKVGRFRMEQQQFIEIGVFEDDLITREFIKGLRIPMTSLGLGKNEWRGSGVLKNLTIFVQSGEDSKKAPGELTCLDSAVTELDASPTVMVNHTDQIADQLGIAAKKAMNDAGKVADDASKAMDGAGKQVQKGVSHLKRYLEGK